MFPQSLLGILNRSRAVCSGTDKQDLEFTESTLCFGPTARGVPGFVGQAFPRKLCAGTRLTASSGTLDRVGSGSTPERLQSAGVTAGDARASPLLFEPNHSLKKGVVRGK